MNRKKEREFNGVWNVERLLSNYLLFADKDGCITIPEQGEATPYVIRQRRFLAALNRSGILLDYFLVYFSLSFTKEPVINGKGHYNIWQFSENGQVKGIPRKVDLNRFHPDFDISKIRLY